jgi:hypothetical protein
MRGVIDKAGFNRLLTPYQSPFFPLNQSSIHTIMPCTTTTYTILFDPVHNGPGELATAKEMFNCHSFVKKRGSRVSPYPAFVDIYKRSDCCVVNSKLFEDLYLADFVEANKRQEIIFGAFGCVLIWLL